MATIGDQKSALQKWIPVIAFDVVLKDATPRYWTKQAVSFGGNFYIAIVLDHSELRVEGNGVYGVDAVMEISLSLNNADANLNPLIVPQNWQGGTIQPRFFFLNPEDGTTTTDSIVYPKFLIDLPRSTWPRVEFSAHNKWNLARKMVPVSLVTRKDRYPFPDTAAERTAAGSDPSSEFYASGYDPATGKGNWKTPPSTPYTRADYDGTREKLKEIGLEVRFGGFGKAPPTIVATPKKGERADYFGNANEAKFGQAVPLLFGICRTQPIVLDTGFPEAWMGSRLSHYLLSDGVNFAPEHINGIEDVLDVFIPDNPKFQRIPETSNEPQTTGAWSFQGGYYGSQKAPASSKYRNIDAAVDFPTPAAEFPDRDLYSGLAYLEVGFPKELSGQDGIGPKIEAIVKGLKLEYWDTGGSSDWAWTDNPVWIFVHLLKLLRWAKADLDLASIATAAAYCEALVPSGKKRFRCNLALTQQTRAADVLRGIRNNCRMYTAFAPNGKLQLKIAQNVAGEGGLAFNLDGTNIMRGDDGELRVEKFHRSIFEMANIFSVSFQNEENFYNVDSVTKADIPNINQIDEKVSADSIFPILGIPSFDQAERQIEWMRQEQTTLNEYYKVVCSLALIENKVGQIGTITEPRHGLIAQQVRIRAMAPGPEAATVELTLQKHSDGAYTDLSVSTPFTRAQGDSSYTPRAVGGKLASSPAPILTLITVADPINADTSVRRIRVEFKPPAQAFEGSFSRETKIRDVIVATSGGTIPGDQVLFVEIAPVKAGLRGLASEFLMVNVPAGGNSNTFSVKCQLPPEADQYILFVGNFPGQTYEQTVAASPGTSEFTITVTSLIRNFGSIPPDPKFDHVHIFYSYNSSPDVLRDGGRTFAPDENTLEFEPEAPAAEDTQVTVYVSSANAAEDDFYPINISPKALLTLTYETGPPMDWEAHIMPGPTPTSVFAKFTRPKINGKRLFWVAVQFKDSSVGVWRESDENAGAAVTYYDGSGISHESIGGLKIKKDPLLPVGFGTASADDLMMMDVAGGAWDKDRCGWGTIEKFLDDLGAETTGANARYIATTGGLFRPQTTQDLRMKIVKPHHTWDTEGYLGNPDGVRPNGVEWEWIGDREGDEFIIGPYDIGRDISSVDCRFWIENDYCRSGNNLTHSSEGIRVHAGMDDAIPGPLVDLLVEGLATGMFVATWKDPLVGSATIDDTAVSYSESPTFTPANTSTGWGRRNILNGLDPGKTYYWRLAVHNKSDQPSHSSTTAELGPTGWGPWTYPTPNPVTSGAGGGPQDSVIPGPLVSLDVQGLNGEFIAKWNDPATGNLTIDNYREQYALDAGFTSGLVTTNGLGYVNTVRGTDPGKTYYFRFAAHNKSGLASHASTAAALGPTGWGPWTTFPSAVSSGGVPGAPVDNQLPSAVQSLSVTGKNGKFLATWLDPALGYQTIDDTAIQYCDDAAFTLNGPGSPAKGWGKRNSLESTAPNEKYWFRVAVHNKSGLTSDSSTIGLGATGWGPWAAAPGNPVSSGNVPLDAIQVSESLVYNGGFEQDNNGDGKPDGWIFFEGNSAISWENAGTKIEGAVGLAILSSGVHQGGIASDAFPVTAGEKLWFSCWVIASASACNGLYIRIFFHPNDMNFLSATSGTTYIDLLAAANPPTTWTKYEYQFTVPAGMGYCRVGLYNYGNLSVAINHHFDDVMVQRRVGGGEIQDNTLPPGKLTGEARQDFIETWEAPISDDIWGISGSGTATRQTVGGVNGTFYLYCDGSLLVLGKQAIPFDPRRLYRMSIRIGCGSLNAGHGALYVGVNCLDANKNGIGEVRCIHNGFVWFGARGASTWFEDNGYFKGLGGTAYAGPSPDAGSPLALPSGTTYISPILYINYGTYAAGIGDIFWIDDIRIDAFEEGQYRSDAPNGTFTFSTKQVHYPYPAVSGEAKTSAVNLWWDYTQGLVKAHQFSVTVTSGSIGWVERVRCVEGNGAVRHLFTVFGLIWNASVSITVQAEAVAYGGQVAQTPGISFGGAFTPSVSSGSNPGGVQNDVGYMDWAGGNIWYDSIQYRNNVAPSTAPGAGITIQYFANGSGGVRARIDGLNTYSQGTHIATHIAVLITQPDQTIVLTRDMVVTYISMGSLPATFEVPIMIPDSASCRITVAAVAETRNGRSFNTTFPTGATKTAGRILLRSLNTGADRAVQIGQSGVFTTEWIEVHSPLQFHDVDNGAYRGRIYARGTDYIFDGLSGTWNFGFNTSQCGVGTKVLAIGDHTVNPGASPGGVGFLFSYASGGYWRGTSTQTNFAPAGPHCAKCGYDYWLVAARNPAWRSYIYVCGWCGAVYKKGPKSVLNLLTDDQKKEIINKQNAGLYGPREAWEDAEVEKSRKRRLRRSGSGQRRQSDKNCLRRARSKPLRARH